MVFDAIWLFQALILCQSLIFEAGWTGWIGLTAFVAYKLVATVGAWPLASEAARRPAAKLLLLRVFGFRERTERLFDLLGRNAESSRPIAVDFHVHGGAREIHVAGDIEKARRLG